MDGTSAGPALRDVLAALPADLPALCLSEGSAAAVRQAGRATVVARPVDVEAGTVAAAVLADGELTCAGAQAEGLLARCVDVLRPGGAVVAVVARGEPEPRGPRRRPAARESPVPDPPPRRYTAAQVEHLLAHRGVGLERLEVHGDLLLAVGRAPVGEAERSSRFVASLPFVLLTSAVVCRDEDGRLLCVYDRYKQSWTIPGGVVDAGEDPRTAAVRECSEEAGLRVRAGDLLGLFCTAAPSRVLTVYAAEPLDPADPAARRPRTRWPHEIGDVAWLPLPDALRRFAASTRWQVERCLEAPGETWAE